MAGLIVYKAVLAALLVATASLGGSTYYSQQQMTGLNNKVSNLNDQITQLKSLNLQTQSQNSQLSTQLNQLQTEISQLQVQYVPFSVSSDTSKAYINLTFSEPLSYYFVVMAVLLNQTQYHLFTCCDTTNANNYTLLQTTWSSPWSYSYSAQVYIPNSGNWYVAFFDTPGYAYPGDVTETITLTTQ